MSDLPHDELLEELDALADLLSAGRAARALRQAVALIRGAPPVPLTVERLTELARIFNKETQEYTSEMSRHAVRDFAKWLASRLIPQPEEKTKP